MRRSSASAALPPRSENTVTVPIYQSAAYQFESFAAARDTFALRRQGNIYSRSGNPTNAVLERRVADLESGAGALAVGSGQAGVAIALLTLVAAAGPGSHHIVASNKLYGGTSDLLGDTFADFAVEVTFVDPLDIDAWTAALRETTRAMATPVLLRPIEHGADIVVHSATKYLGGHGTSIAGVIVDAGHHFSRSPVPKASMTWVRPCRLITLRRFSRA